MTDMTKAKGGAARVHRLIDQVLDHDRMARRDGRPAPADDLQRLLDARAQLVQRVAEADRIITDYVLSRLVARLYGDDAETE
jgi:hypothetical protein